MYYLMFKQKEEEEEEAFTVREFIELHKWHDPPRSCKQSWHHQANGKTRIDRPWSVASNDEYFCKACVRAL
jgi:hypothetical protein